MSLPGAVVGLFRTHWENRFIDSGTLNRETSAGTYNSATLQNDGPTSSQVFDGACLIRPTSRSEADFGERLREVEGYSVFVPYTASGAQPGDEFTVGSCTYDPDLAGAVLVVREVIEDSYLTKYEWVTERIK